MNTVTLLVILFQTNSYDVLLQQKVPIKMCQEFKAELPKHLGVVLCVKKDSVQQHKLKLKGTELRPNCGV